MKLDRRSFLRKSAVAGAIFAAAPFIRTAPPGRKFRTALIGCGSLALLHLFPTLLSFDDLAANRFQLDDFQPLLYKTTDFGATWTKIVAGIPADQFTRVIREDPVRLRRRGAVRCLRHETRPDLRRVPLRDLVLERGGDQHVDLDLEQPTIKPRRKRVKT